MAEGDTIYRTAVTLADALEGREVTEVGDRSPAVRRLDPRRLVGQHVDTVEPRGKHLLVWFEPSRLALHTHMRMSGSWHLYPPGERWRKPSHLAKVWIRTAEWVAVCFSAPVCELLSNEQVARHPTLAALGPDPLGADGDNLDEARRRLDRRPDVPIGEALLDQRVLAGVGNVYRCEVCFILGIDPWTPVGELDGEVRDALLRTAMRLLQANVADRSPQRVTAAARSGGADRHYVYGRARRPCPRCATPIAVARQGTNARLTYWCPHCQGPGPSRSPSVAAATIRPDHEADNRASNAREA
ncbi:Fpg/Nei family DNA glycosylase [Egibacter rhizosphaerae]|uniref:DNA-(apurinic or apyrimidinic site) lyase n=1 Tax=Egibacter rhizosphaerae TaxID=1670831 RepID=A0A411YDC4_9ACTN|nr:DNA-formamidopyrimidine glycosylase family protein [Egibacter rhizosphaerae]QBI19176.1 Fpg/Nei family DNA glycosylase [Egibacter rhizosphaerae]